MVNCFVTVGSKVLCAALLLFQGVMINAYLSKLYFPAWWSWIVADVAIIIIWISCLVILQKRHYRRRKDCDAEQSPSDQKYTYIAWVVYVTLLCPRIVLLFADLAKTLDEKDDLGPNLLKMAVSCTPLIFFFLVHGSHNSKSYTARHLSIQAIAATGALDLFDSIDILEFSFLPEEGIKFPRGYLHASLAFACVSFFMPVLSLYDLHHKALSGRIASLYFKVINILLNLLVINLPNLVIRSILWHKYNMDVSVLLMKNIMAIVAEGYELLEYFGEFRPLICAGCGYWFERSVHSKHEGACGDIQSVSLSSVHRESPALGTIADPYIGVASSWKHIFQLFRNKMAITFEHIARLLYS